MAACGSPDDRSTAPVEVATSVQALEAWDLGAYELLSPEQAINYKAAALAVDFYCPERINLKVDKYGNLSPETIPAHHGLGDARGDITPTPDDNGHYQEFEFGAIVWSPEYGAVPMPWGAFHAWDMQAREELGQKDRPDLDIGFPMDSHLDLGGCLDQSWGDTDVENANLTYLKGRGVFVRGGFRDLWRANSWLGAPLSDDFGQRDWPAGARQQAFDGGHVYSRSDVQFVVLPDPMGYVFAKTGGVNNYGWPLLSEGEGEEWRAITDKGTLYYRNGELLLLSGPVFEAYKTEYGGETGPLGYPVSSVGKSPRNQFEFIDFEHGVLVRHPNATKLSELKVTAFPALQFNLTQAQGKGSEGLCGDLDLYVKLSLWKNGTALVSQERHPGGDGYSGQTYRDIGVVKGLGVASSSLVVDATVEVFDSDGGFCGDPEHLGDPKHRFDIDNLWGKGETIEHVDGSAVAWFNVAPVGAPIDPDHFRRDGFWAFRNFTTDRLDYDKDFAETFADVEPGESEGLHPLNHWFYNNVYKDLANGGNCLGMTVESVFAGLGRSNYTTPLSWWAPRDETTNNPVKEDWGRPIPGNGEHDSIMHVLNVRHGHQLGGLFLGYVANQILNGATHDPKGQAQAVESQLQQGAFPLVSITTGYFGEGGHSIRPYAVSWRSSGRSSGIYDISIADPNYPEAYYPDDSYDVLRVTYDDADLLESRVDQANFSYHEGNDQYGNNYEDKYTGGRWAGGRMYSIPYDVYAPTPSTPLSFEGLGAFLGSAEAGVAQVSDENGRRLFKPGSGALPTRWDELEEDASLALNAVVPIPLSDGAGRAGQIFAGPAARRTLRYDVTLKPGVASGTVYSVLVGSKRLSSLLEIPGTSAVPERITAHAINRAGRAVSLALPEESEPKEVTWTVVGADQRRWARFSRLALEPGQAVTIHTENNGRRVVVDNDGPATHAELTVSGPDGEVSLGQVRLPSGQGVAELDLPDAALLLPAPDGLGGWYRAPVRVTLEGKDLTGAGIAAVEWRSGDAGAWSSYAGPFTFATEGATTLEYRAVDGDGRASRPKAAEIKVDTRAPVLGLGAARTVTRTTVLSPELLASDPVPGSGLASSSGALDGVPLPTTGTVDLFWLPLGAHQLAASASDVAGWTTSAVQELSLTATLASLEETVRELRRRGELTSDAVQESFLYSIRKASEAQDRAARSGWLTSWVHELEAKARLDALVLKFTVQRGWRLSARGADLLLGDVHAVKGTL